MHDGEFKYVVAKKGNFFIVGLSPIFSICDHESIFKRMNVKKNKLYSAGFIRLLPCSLFLPYSFHVYGDSESLNLEHKEDDKKIITNISKDLDLYKLYYTRLKKINMDPIYRRFRRKL
jgi:hypothetical protein